VYTVPVAGHHQVNLRFLVGEVVAGETVQLALDQAITSATGGGPIPVPALTFAKK
jgi:hypothetical protein